MNILIFFIVLTAAIGGEFLTIYLAYLSVSRQKVTQKQLLHASFVVLGYSMMAGILLKLAGLPKSISMLITAALVYIMGRMILHQSSKQAWASVGIYIAIILALAAGLMFLMNDTFREMMMYKAE